MRALPKGIRSDVRTCNRSPSICAFRTMCCSACSGPTRRTRSLARRRQRKTSRGVPVGAEVFCRPAAAIDQMGRPGKPPRRSRGKPRTSLLLHMRQKISRGEVCSISRQNISRGEVYSVRTLLGASGTCHSSRKARAPRRSRRNRLAGTPPGSRRSSSSSSSHSVLSGIRCGSGGAPDHQYPKE